jgi:hypothetical protein
MAMHTEFPPLVSDILKEYLCAAEYCLKFEKTAENGPWSDNKGSLGTAAAVLLFCIVDAIGHHEGFGFEASHRFQVVRLLQHRVSFSCKKSRRDDYIPLPPVPHLGVAGI